MTRVRILLKKFLCRKPLIHYFEFTFLNYFRNKFLLFLYLGSPRYYTLVSQLQTKGPRLNLEIIPSFRDLLFFRSIKNCESGRQVPFILNKIFKTKKRLKEYHEGIIFGLTGKIMSMVVLCHTCLDLLSSQLLLMYKFGYYL